MFCSTCKRIEIEFNEVKKKICDNGHILCCICDKSFEDCQICRAKFKNLIYVRNSFKFNSKKLNKF